MEQIRLFARTDKPIAHALMEPLDLAFAEIGIPVSVHENPDLEDDWTISIYVPNTEVNTHKALLQEILDTQGLDLKVQTETLPTVDWVAETLQQLAPVRAGNFIIHGDHDREAPRPHEIAVEINAGLAFGTGHHGTTAGCLDMYFSQTKQRKFTNVLDLGTGSGVLAIAIAKDLKQPVLATDIDPVATLTAQDNAKINQVHPWMVCETANGLNHNAIRHNGPFDLIIANILAKPLQSMALEIAKVCAPNATIILSGLLPHQRAAITARFHQHGMVFQKSHIRDGWLTLVLSKRSCL